MVKHKKLRIVSYATENLCTHLRERETETGTETETHTVREVSERETHILRLRQ